jgi:hypothetical protein
MSKADFLQELFVQAYKKHDHTRSESTSIHVSDLINFCPREYFLCSKHDKNYHQFQFFGMQTKYDFDMGHAIQRVQVERLMTLGVVFSGWKCNHCGRREYGYHMEKYVCSKCKCRSWKAEDVGIELPIPLKTKPKSQLVVRGHTDYLVHTGDQTEDGHQELMVVDAKSISADYFDKLGARPSIDYQRQVQLYMWLFNNPDAVLTGHPRKGAKRVRVNPHEGAIAYGVKGSRKIPIKPLPVEQDGAFIKGIERRLQTLAKSLESNRCPKKICTTQRDAMAKKCAARDVCFGQNLLKKKGGKKK